MDRFGHMARDHWKRHLPRAYAQLTDPEAFFTELGEEAFQQVCALEDALAGSDVPGEDFVAKAGRLTNARQTAESQVIRELILIEPESDE